MTSSSLLPAKSDMGAVTLWVADLDKMIRYYRDAIGLELFSEVNGRAFLGQGTTTIVILESKPGMKYASPGEAGLFHTAILFFVSSCISKSCRFSRKATSWNIYWKC